MKIALCHLELSCGPQERNLQLLEQAVRLAAEQGADWVLTPEAAVQGYYFYRIDENAVVVPQPSLELEPLRKLCCEYGITLFLGCGEYDAACDKNFNSCLVFGPDGELIGRHRKLFGECMASEAWARKGDSFTVLPCSGLQTGVLVCADLWFPEFYEGTKAQGAEIIVDMAAWPPTQVCGNPLPAWINASKVTDVTIIVCNQTGSPQWMDMNVGQSVVIDQGELKLAYSGEPAVLLFDYDADAKCVQSLAYDVHYIK